MPHSKSSHDKNGRAAENGSSGPFLIVGVGASAGGLEAFTALLQQLPEKSGMAFVLVQHLSPDHKSMLSEILSRKCAMPVTEAVNGMEVRPDNVYVIPPNACMTIQKGHLHLQNRGDAAQQPLPIDFFLCSLAEYQKEKAVAVILSGTASDGSLGCQVVKSFGGVTFAQSPETAAFDMMPRNAAATGCVDFVMSPEQIAKELLALNRHPYHDADAPMDRIVPEGEVLQEILTLLHKHSGVDFKNYKMTTVRRRVFRRMMLKKAETLDDYRELIRTDAAELQTLSSEIFITVTRFFRDPEIFKALRREVFPVLLASKAQNEPIRIWTTGCSTGEEAYSLAIEVSEFLESQGRTDVPVQIFATDIVAPSIEHARLGIYSEAIVNDVPPEKLKRFFRKIDRGYQINKTVRDMCIFARQNITADPPFSKVDLISCRNLLIYLDNPAQKKVIPILHYALNPKGFLLLGQSESVVTFSELFSVVDKKAKIYLKKPVSRPPSFALSTTAGLSASAAARPAARAEAPSVSEIQKEADRIVLRSVDHSGLVVNEAMEVMQFRGDTSRYVKHLAGTASLNLFKMLQESFLVQVRESLRKAAETNVPARSRPVRVHQVDEAAAVVVTTTPFRIPPDAPTRYFLIDFEEMLPQAADAPKAELPEAAGEATLPEKDLHQELEATRLHLQSLIDEKEQINESLHASNEEILSANEELQSLNEELQSANEELESAKEELQATNEEINTLNDELQSRNAQLGHLNDEHLNMMESIDLALVMVDRDLRIRRFSPTAESMFRLSKGDVGRPMRDVRLDLDLEDLDAVTLGVIASGDTKEMELHSRGGRWFKTQVRPYVTTERAIEGAVITCIDVTSLKSLGIYRDAILQTMREPFLILNSVLRVKSANRAYYETFRTGPHETVGQLFFGLGKDQWNVPKLRQLLEDVIPKKTRFSDCEVDYELPGLGLRTMLVNASQVFAESEGEDTILVAIEDITEYKQRAFLSTIVESSDDAIVSKRPDGTISSWNKGAERLFGYTEDEVIGRSGSFLVSPEKQKEEAEILERIRRGEHIHHYEMTRIRKDGSTIEVSLTISPIKNATDEVTGLSEIAHDITKLKRSEAHLGHLNHELEQFTAIASHDLQAPLRKILTYTEKLSVPDSDENKEMNFRRLAQAALRMKGLIEALLDFSKADKRRAFKKVDLGQVVSAVVGRMEGKDGVEIVIGALPTIDGDEILLQQMFYNLIENAIKYRKKGEPGKIAVSSRSVDNVHEIRVQDDGIGFDVKHLDKIFKPLQRLHGNEEYQGNGIGLATCERIVQHHGGHITANSFPGKGSTFIVTFPVRKA